MTNPTDDAPLVNQPSEAEYYGLTASTLARPRGSLTMTTEIPHEMTEFVAAWTENEPDWATYKTKCPNAAHRAEIHAVNAIRAVRQWDREQRAKLDASLAPVSDPDDYRDLPTSMTMSHQHSGGLTTGKRP